MLLNIFFGMHVLLRSNFYLEASRFGIRTTIVAILF